MDIATFERRFWSKFNSLQDEVDNSSPEAVEALEDLEDLVTRYFNEYDDAEYAYANDSYNPDEEAA